jgi:hypothetical protein
VGSSHLINTNYFFIVTVGQPVTRLPPHRSQRAELPHWALQRYSLP